MTAREQLYRWIDRLPDSEGEALQRFAKNNRLDEVDDEPLTEADLEAIRSGEEDFRQGRVQSLDDFLEENP